MYLRPIFRSCTFALTLFAALRVASADTQYWQGDSTTPWDIGVTPVWYDANTNTSNTTWANGNQADFTVGGTVNVDAAVSVVGLSAASISGDLTFAGTNPITFDGYTGASVNGSSSFATTFDSVNVNMPNHAPGGNDYEFLSNYGTGKVTFNNLYLENTNNYPANYEITALQVTDGGTLAIGNVTEQPGYGGRLDFNFGGNNGVVALNGTIQSGITFTVWDAGTVYLNNSNLGGNFFNLVNHNYSASDNFYTDAAVTISNNFGNQSDTMESWGTVYSGTSTFNSDLAIYGDASFVAQNGGTVIFNGSIHNSLEHGIVTSGNGTVILNQTGGNNYDNGYWGTGQAGSLGAKWTIIQNTSGDAFGARTGSTLTLLSGSGLGGSGITTEMLTVTDATSVIAPGVGSTTPTTLHLNGGLTITNGLTMDFKLDGLSSDSIDFGGTYMSLNGTITFNFTGVPVISVANDNGEYKILTGLNLDLTNDVTNNNNGDYNFVFNAPAGYSATFGVGRGGTDAQSNDGGQDYIFVKFTATPEPSTYGMLALGLVGLLAFERFRLRARS